MSSTLSVPAPLRGVSSSPSPLEGQTIPAASPVPMDADDNHSGSSSSSSASAAAAAYASGLVESNYMRHPTAAPLTAAEERNRFSKIYDPVLEKDGIFAVIPAKWFESWQSYSGFDREAAERARAARSSAAAAAAAADSEMADGEKSSNGGSERPGFIDCSSLIQPAPENLDLSVPNSSTDKLKWVELRTEAQENVDFIVLNYDAFMLLCEWYGSGPIILRKVIQVGLSAQDTIELHPTMIVISSLANNEQPNGTIALESRRVRQFSKSTLLSELIEECKPKIPGMTAEARSKMEGRVWRRRVAKLDANVEAEGGAGDAMETNKSPSGLTATQSSPAQFIRQWELISKADYPHKLEFLELERGTEFLLEYRANATTPYQRRGNGSLVRSWKELKKGDILDCKDPEDKWYQAEIISEINTTPHPKMKEQPWARVHFLNWSVKYDEDLLITADTIPDQPLPTSRWAEKYTWTNGPHIPNIPKKKVQNDMDSYYSSYNRIETGPPEVKGAVGLRNLGNTCFMNSTLQCLANAPGLTEFFTEGKYKRHLNRTNPLGYKGKIAEEYGGLLAEIWSGQYATVTPRAFKQVIGDFCPRFAGYAQQDSSELLAFLLDGLHEDLNRVLQKPATQPVESNGRPDAIVAQESWQRHLLRNQSVVVDTLQGQLKSCVVCPTCHRESITFDPFMFLSVPLPVPNSREFPVIVIQSGTSPKNGSAAPYVWPLRISKAGVTIDELKSEVANTMNASPKQSTNLALEKVDPKCFIAVEVYQNKIFKVMANDYSSGRIQKNDVIIFYHVPELEKNTSEKEVYTTLQLVHSIQRQARSERVGIPLVISVPTDQLKTLPMKLLRETIKKALAPFINQGRGWGGENDADLYTIQLRDRSTETMIMELPYKNAAGEENFTVNLTEPTLAYHARVGAGAGMSFALQWKIPAAEFEEKLLLRTDTLEQPPHIREANAAAPKKEGLDLGDCLEAFSKEETLRESEAWYCSKCKEHKTATKKFDLWRVPDILVIQLKRFTYDSYRRDKLDAYVDFPLENLDLAKFMVNEQNKNNPSATTYDLFAVSNHYGGLGGGHYTAYAKNLVNGRWYNLDDSSATIVSNPASVKSAAAYMLFYRRKAAKFDQL